MRTIELILSPELYSIRELQNNHASVAVDILRATSAICAAFSAGASEIVPLNSLEALEPFRKLGYVIAAERNGKKVDGALCGNSPTEYLTMNLVGKRLAYSTTNGTVSILKASESERLYVGAFANLSTLAQRLLADTIPDIVILCSGWKGTPSIEDTIFAGALIEKLMQSNSSFSLQNDAAMMALDLWGTAKSDLYAYCNKATHVARLRRLNYENDIRWALKPDTCPLVPTYDKQKGALFLS